MDLDDVGILEKSMGVLLVDFLRLFGRSLNNEDVGISCTNGGYFFNKLDAQKEQAMRPYMLSVEDPADPDNDLSKGSWNFLKVSTPLPPAPPPRNPPLLLYWLTPKGSLGSQCS